MDDWVRKELDDRITKLERETVRLRKGVITDSDPLSVALGGADADDAIVGLSAIDGLALAVDDVVTVLARRNDMLVVGRVGGKRIASGTATVPYAAQQDNGVAVSHGLGTAPSRVVVTCRQARFAAYCSTRTSTQLFIGGYRVDGVNTGDVLFDWIAIG